MVRPDDTLAAGQRAASNSASRKRHQDFGSSSLHLEDSSGQGWLWSPRTGDIAETRRAASAETFRRRSPSWDLFAEGGPADVCLTPRGQRRANLACIARGEAPATALAPSPRTPRSPRTGQPAKPRQASQPPPKSTQGATTQSAPDVRVHVGELSSVHRARACSVKGHHYKNKSLTSSGLWRDLPLYTPWGLLESTQQPSVSCANVTASRAPSAKRQGEPVVAPYAHAEPEAPVTPRLNSAREQYQKAMCVRSPMASQGDGKTSVASLDGRSGRRPRGTSSPSQQIASGGSARARGQTGRGYPPVNNDVTDASKEPLASPRSPLAESGVPAGMHTRLGRVAIVNTLDGATSEVEILPAATRRSDDCLHGIEESRVTPRRFSLPSQRGVSRQKISTSSGGGATSCQTPRPKVKATNGNMDLKLELAGLRRARAASSGFSARRKPQRWQV